MPCAGDWCLANDDCEDERFPDDDEPGDICKHGGPAPCIDDICHALGGCMHYEGDVQP